MGDPASGRPEFPATAWSLIVQLSSTAASRQKGLDRLFRLYQTPILGYLRSRWPKKTPEDLEDLAAGFFTHLVEKCDFSQYDRGRGSFRAFLKIRLKSFACDEHEREGAKKRGGDVLAPADWSRVEQFVQDHRSQSPDEILDLLLMEDLTRQAMNAAHGWCDSTGRDVHWKAFDAYVLTNESGRTYGQVAADLSLKESDLRNHIHGVRERVKHELREILRPGVQDPDRDLDEEYRSIFGKN